MKPDLVDDIFSFLFGFFLCAFYFNSRLINAASEMTFVGKLCVWDKKTKFAQTYLCIPRQSCDWYQWFSSFACCQRLLLQIWFFSPIFRVTNVTTSGERTPKTTVFIVSNGGIDTVSLHSLNFCLLTNKVRHWHWIIVIHWQG